jgi:hypothetical protein
MYEPGVLFQRVLISKVAVRTPPNCEPFARAVRLWFKPSNNVESRNEKRANPTLFEDSLAVVGTIAVYRKYLKPNALLFGFLDFEFRVSDFGLRT